ncbi:3305_t:CDS:10 [Dentiscutata erythropus]|uniref:3305_t:CDS:1 n=1 Tax=Dentiscutata erythropus TaxID=1348616 RepID=A0A9N9BT02_9GLOM|nr:3305_t:CDS:10 [Dentiscutata erythropus]
MIVDLSPDEMLSDTDDNFLNTDNDNFPNVSDKSDKGGCSEHDTIVSDALSDGLSDNNDHDIGSEKQKDVDLSSGDMLEDGGSMHDKIEIDNNQFSYERRRKDKRIDGHNIIEKILYELYDSNLFIYYLLNSEITKPQGSFQPGATPEKNNRRYLAMNHIGCITTTFHETTTAFQEATTAFQEATTTTTFHETYSTITVEFHDQSYNRGYNLRDEFNYSMACLESSEMPDSQTNPSVLFYKPQETWASKSEWTLTLPQGEDIIAIALSSQSIIVATSKDVIRFFSLCGVQTYIFALKSVVCMVGYEEFVLIVYHAGVGYKGSQNLGYILYNVRSHDILQKDELPLTKGSTLQWMGFSLEGMPAIFDSKGVLSVLHHHRQFNQARWVPILDVSINRKAEEINWTYWPVWLTETTLFCFICKSEAFPQIPRSAFDEISWKIPLWNLDRQTGQYEEKIVRFSILASYEFEEAMAKNELDKAKQSIKKKNKEMDKALLEMIHFACKEEKQQRALDLSKLLITNKSLESAAKVNELRYSKTGSSSTTVPE